ncbi:MAG: ribonuclease P protein component [Candidatus Buchananbacteria bacterium RBG_13_36_9]|uniref:Ribonuclease P protein component n=1 Tax=Candidatus Buchananbacteria bacterium RBG_13_36_9 TaxID=1797530 RepID=A0A1G1XN73_9BACT|nr:MAG: ribonuclease P protein component [Candidatus Buchananbacteria bacterium RBG_13_36_9]
MLKKEYRLSKDNDFKKFNQTKKAVYSPILIMKFLENQMPISRFGLIVSTKVSKKANKRNLIRRRLNEILRLNLVKIKKGYDILIIISPKVINSQGKTMAYKELEDNLLTALRKVKLL